MSQPQMNDNLEYVFDQIHSIEVTLRGKPNASDGLKKIKFTIGPAYSCASREEIKKVFLLLVDYSTVLKSIRDPKM
jgi:hypothetical protein